MHWLVMRRGVATWAARACSAVLPLAAGSGLSFFLLYRPVLEQLHQLSRQVALSGAEVFVVVASTHFVILFPAILLSSPKRATHHQWWRLVGLLLLGFFVIFDVSVFSSVGRHVADTVAFWSMDGAFRAAGGLAPWAGSALRALFLAALLAGAVHWGALVLERSVLWGRLVGERLDGPAASTARGGVLGLCVSLAVLILSALLPLLPHGGGGWTGMEERVYGTLPIDLRWGIPSATFKEGPVGHLENRLRGAYLKRYAAIEKRVSARPFSPEPPPGLPSVVLIVVESWRADASGIEWTPGIAAWAKREALVFAHHEAGTHSSQAALFSLLYGRNNLTYHQTLDADVRAFAFEWFKTLGYRTGYFSGQPVKWIRQEEFLNSTAVDIWAHDDRGDWPDWDRRALRRVIEEVEGSEAPLFAVAFLMSSHFEYQYPSGYERHLPVAKSKMWKTKVAALGEADRVPHLNRYRNSLAFVDDLVTETIAALPEDAVVLVTGDHGEAFHDGGFYGHGFNFADVVRKVPLFARFPSRAGAPSGFTGPGRIEGRTLHEDVLGWLMTYLIGPDVRLPGFQGTADFTRVPLSRPVLSTYARPGGRMIDAQLRFLSGERTLRLSLGLARNPPHLRFRGFEDEAARPTPAPVLDEETLDAIEQSFTQELLRVTR